MKQDNRNIASDLIESTVKVIARDGFDKASTRNIAGACGIADAYIYVHFKDKDDLFAKAFQKEDAALAGEVRKYLPILNQSGITNEDRLYFLFSQTWRHLIAYPNSCRFFIQYYYSPYYAKYSAQEHLDHWMQEVPSSTTRKVWWKCSVCGNEWEAAVSSRIHGRGCPICAGKVVAAGVNDFASRYPEIAAEWHPTKNGKLMPNAVTGQSNKSVWWVCPEGHEYKAIVSSRTASGSGCPYCTNRRVLPGFNDLASRLPEVAKEWHPTMNCALTPEQVTCGSAKKVWWKCNACGYEWKAIICSRAGAQRCGCPMCAGKVKVNAKQEYYEKIVFDIKTANDTGLPLSSANPPNNSP